MNHKGRGFWIYSAPAIFYGIIVIIATGTPGDYIPSVDIANFDKVVHFLLHFLFAMLVHRALLYHANGTIVRSQTLLLTLVSVAMFGILVEWYQVLIPGRNATVADAAANILGAVTYSVLYPLVLWRVWPERMIRSLRN